MSGKSNRLIALDGMRGVAACFVVLIHVFPGWQEYPWTEVYLRQGVARFAVPFFFAASGFFMAAKEVSFERTWPRVKSIFKLYFIWSLIYLVMPRMTLVAELGWSGAYEQKLRFLQKAELLLLVGPGFHLWFLISLMSSMLAFVWLKPRIGLAWLTCLALALYVLGALSKGYAQTAFGIELPINGRNFIFFSLFPFCLGAYVKQWVNAEWMTVRLGVALFIFALCAHIAEGAFLQHTYGVRPVDDFVFATAFMGVGALIIGVKGNSLLASKPLVVLGGLSMGIYVLHPLVGWNFGYLFRVVGFGHFWGWAAPIVTITISGGLVVLMSKNELLRRLLR